MRRRQPTRPPVTPPRGPWIARDATRAWVAFGFCLVPGAVVGVLAGPSSDGSTLLRGQLLATIALMVAYFAMYALLTWLAFRRLERDALERVLRTTRPRRTSAKVALALSGGGATSWSTSAALVSLVVLVLVAFRPTLHADAVVLVMSGLLVVSSWLVVAVTYAVQYMRTDVAGGGLAFPGDERPVFSDYCYLALQISTTYSSSDVQVTAREMRRRVGRHTLVAFVFNSVIVALLVSALLVGASG